MTKKQIYELVRMTHPTATIPEINLWINAAMDDLFRYSRFNKVTTTIVTTADTASYALNSLYIDIVEVKTGTTVLSRILGDVNIGENDGLEDDRYYYWLFDNAIYIVEGGDTTSYPAEGLDVIITAIKKEADVSSTVEVPTGYPSCFYEAIIAKVTASLFGRGYEINLKAMRFFEERYAYLKKMVRREAFIRMNSASRTIVQHSY